MRFSTSRRVRTLLIAGACAAAAITGVVGATTADATTAPSVSSPTTVIVHSAVPKPTPTVTLTLAASSAPAGTRNIRATIAVAGIRGVYPTGQLQIRAVGEGNLIMTTIYAWQHGVVTTAIQAPKKGTYILVASYSGDSAYGGGASASQVFVSK